MRDKSQIGSMILGILAKTIAIDSSLLQLDRVNYMLMSLFPFDGHGWYGLAIG
jgi:hypothetical protein